MTFRPTALRSAAVLALVLAAPIASAQDKDADAERLFKEAKELMEARKFAEACPKLEQVYRKDQQQGTLLNLAYCHKEMGASWLAWVEFREAESKASDAKRKDFARDKMKELEKGLTRLQVDLNPKYELTEVSLEDRRIYDAETGKAPFFAEPNHERKVVFRAKGKKAATVLVTVGAPKDKVQHVAVPDMVDDDPVPPPTAIDTAPATPAAPPPKSETGSSWSGMKTAAVIMGVAGVGGVVVGSIFGLKAMGSDSCTDGPPDPDGNGGGAFCSQADHDSASSAATISTIGFVAGGALLAGAVVVWILAPNGKTQGSNAPVTLPMSVTASVGPTWAGLRGTF